MKKIINVNNADTTTDVALLIARVGIAALMLTHGIPKLIMLVSGTSIQFPAIMGMSSETGLALTVFAEVFCSVFILLGFATRAVTIPLIMTMLVAVFFIHGADPFAMQEPALYYLLVYVVLLVAGSGRYSIDHFLQRKIETAENNKKITEPALAVYHKTQ